MGLATRWLATSEPLGWELPPSEKHRDLAAGELDGGEMSISSFLQAKSRGAPLVALPIFLKRGLVQRSLFCSAGSPLSSPEQLLGKRVGLVSYTSSMAVWIRGVLGEGYEVPSSRVHWFTLTASSHDVPLLSIPERFSAETTRAWEELDGYPHELDRRETFLLTLLDRQELDVVVSFQARIDCKSRRPLIREENLWSHPLSSQIYPINHLFVVKAEAVRAYPTVADSLLSAFREARQAWTAHLHPDDRQICDREWEKLGYDPFAYDLGEVEKKTLERFIAYLRGENLIARKLELDELFHFKD